MELRRRRVFRVAGLYIVAAWVAIQVASLILPAFEVTESAIGYVWIGTFLIFPIAMLFAWRYDITPSGIVRTLPAGDDVSQDLGLRRVDYLVLAAMATIAIVIGIQLGSEIKNLDTDTSEPFPVVELDAFSIAVLPLENISDNAEQQYFVDGMHEAMIADLSRVSALKVISRTSTLNYAATDKPAWKIGSELGAANIIEGSVYRVGNDVRITVRLIDSATDKLLWTQSYERSLEGILRLQSEVARSIASEVRVVLTPEEETFFASADKVNPEAYEAYLKGRFHWYKFTPADLELAGEYFQQALNLNPDYALAYVGYADALATPAHIGLMPATEVFPQAISLVNKALEIDPLLAEAHDMSARLKFVFRHDWKTSEKGFQAAIKLKPSHPDAHVVYSQWLGINGRWEEALAEAREGLRLDPLNDWYRVALGTRLSWNGQYDAALDELLKIAEAQPNWPMVYQTLWDLYFYRGELVQSLTAARRYYRLTEQVELADILDQFDAASEYENAMLALADAVIESRTEAYVSEVDVARILALSGDIERALNWLEKAFDNQNTQLVYTTAEPLYRLVWDHPRYKELRRKMNLPPRTPANTF
jgi:TolB-like protein/Tfp pilus assembly protein PilF